MRFCDHHGWGWEPGQGPSPCVGETLSFWLALGFLATATWATGKSRGRAPYYRYASNTLVQPYECIGSEPAKRIHRAQVALSLLQALISVANGLLCSRPGGMLCLALLMHTLTWTWAWTVAASELRRNPSLSKALLWWWLLGAVSNSIVLSSLHHASHRGRHRIGGEIATLAWLAFLANALLIMLQLNKPEPTDTNGASVYVLAAQQEGVSVTSGWQAFWAGDEPLDYSSGRGRGAGHHVRDEGGCCYGLGFLWHCLRRCCCSCCSNPSSADEDFYSSEAGLGRGAWPTVGGPEAFDTLNDSLLGTVGLGEDIYGGSLLYQTKGPYDDGKQGGCIERASNFLSSIVERRTSRREQGNEGSYRWQQSAASYQAPDAAVSALSVGAGTAIRPRIARGRSGSSSAYSVASRARAPPQASAPVFGVSVTRWRLVKADGTPSAQHGLPTDAWTDRSTDRSSERSFPTSFHTGTTLSDSDTTTRVETASSLSTPTATLGEQVSTAADYSDGNAGAALRVQYGLAVRASGRGEMDWWGRGGDPSAGGVALTSGATTAGDWRVWRSSADVLALYDALALHFGQEFCERVARPQLKTAKISQPNDSMGKAEEARSSPPGSPGWSNAPHRVDISRDARVIGAFLRNLLGLRQFLSTAVMDFLAQPVHEPSTPPKHILGVKYPDNSSADVDVRSWDGSDASACDDSDDDFIARRAGADSRRAYSSHRRLLAAGSGGGKAKVAVNDPKAAGEAVAGAALAAEYGLWLKRLAVRLRRSTPAGERFVRLRRIGPAVTGEQVVRWLVASSGECRGDRASAVRVGQDMVSRGLLMPLCAGYALADDDGGGAERDLLRSFDDAVGWLFAYAGDALRDPFTPPSPTQISVMEGSGLDVRVADWIETSDEQGAHVRFIVRTQVKETGEAWEAERRYRDFTQLRKRLLRLGVDIPTMNATVAPAAVGPDLPKKTWRSDKFDKVHLDSRRAALEAYLQGAVTAAVSAPHLAGHLVMRFLDPDESALRLLAGGNPFATWSSTATARGGGGIGSGAGGGHERAKAEHNPAAAAALKEDKAEEEDFENLTQSLGGFG